MRTLVEEESVVEHASPGTCWQAIKSIAERSWDDRNNNFPVYRRVLLVFSFCLYLIDIGLDCWVAAEYYIANQRGTDEYAKSYLIATLVFIVVPCVIINFVSWALYTWSCLIFYNKNLKNFVIKRLRRLLYRNFDPNQRSGRRNQQQIFAKHNKLNDTSSISCETVFVMNWPMLSSEAHMSEFPSSSVEMKGRKQRSPSTQTVESDTDEDDVDFGLEFYALDFFDVYEYAVVTLLHICLLGYLFRILRLIYKSSSKECKDKYNFDRYRDLSFLRLVESFLEAAPQTILQLYLLVVHTEAVLWYRVVTPISIIISIVSLALSVGDYFSASQDVEHYDPPPPYQKKQQRLSWLAYIEVIVWHFLMIVSRALSFALFATLFGGFVFLIIGVHYVAMIYWMFWQQARVFKRKAGDYSEEERTCQTGRKCCISWHLFAIPCKQICNNCGIEFIVAAFNVFFHFKIRDGGSRYTLIPFYLLTFIENSTMILLWYFVRDSSSCTWYAIPAIVTVFGTFFAGLIIMIIYYQFNVPKQTLVQDGFMHHPSMTSSFARMYRKEIKGNFFKRLLQRNRTSN